MVQPYEDYNEGIQEHEELLEDLNSIYTSYATNLGVSRSYIIRLVLEQGKLTARIKDATAELNIQAQAEQNRINMQTRRAKDLSALHTLQKQRAEAARQEEEAAVQMQQNAGKSFDDALRSYNRQISVMEYEKSLIGETVTEQDRLNTARRVMAALVQNNDIYKTDEAREAAELLFRSAIGYDQLAEAAKRAAAEASRYAEAIAAVRQRQDEEKKNQKTVNGILEEARTAVDNYGKSERQLGVERLRANGALLGQITAYEDYMDQLEKLKKADEAAAIIEDFTDTLKEQYQMMLAGGIQNVFESIGEAWANDANAADAALQAAKQFAAEIIRQTSSLAIAAGLKLIIAGQFAPGIALLALGAYRVL